jgi:hypothetical protein
MDDMNYTLGRGELYFNKFAPNTQVGIGERYFGNTPDLSKTVSSTNLDHYNSDRGVREKDASVPLQTDRTGTFTTDHIDPDNLALWYFGTAEVLTQSSATAETETFLSVKQGLFYQLGATEDNPTGIRSISTVVVTDGATSSPVTYVLGTDYMVNPDLARIEILEGGGIDEDSKIKVTYNTLAATRTVIMSGSQAIEGSLRYVAQNPEGDNIDYFWPWVKLTPNGDYALKSDAWQTIPFNFEVLRRTGYEAVYASTRSVTP